MTAQAGGASLRQQLRAARRQLTAVQRAAADAEILTHIHALPAYRSARRIALFFAFDGEPDLSALIRFDRRKEFFAPILNHGEMHFARLGPQMILEPNFYGIPEPRPIELIDPRTLDLVLMPLVGFDGLGNRIGVGAGYYDRCFAFLRHRRHWFKPKLVGTAYALQRIEPVDPNPWDIPLWSAVTENGIEEFIR